MSYVERDGTWHVVARTEEAEAVTVCDLRIVQQTYLWEREPSPVCSRCKAASRLLPYPQTVVEGRCGAATPGFTWGLTSG